MENKLRKMFDFQRFSGNPDLDEVIRDVEMRHPTGNQGTLLPEEELKNVAGGKNYTMSDAVKPISSIEKETDS